MIWLLLFRLAVPTSWSAEPDVPAVVMAPEFQPAGKPAKAPPSRPGSCAPEGSAFLPTGFTFPALLPDAIFSYNTAAPVVALLEDDVRFRDRIVLPRGTRLIGTANTVHTLDRINITWELAVPPDGCELTFSGLALSDSDGSAGIKGKVEKHEDSIAAHVVLKSMLGAASVAASAAAPMESAIAGGLANETNQAVDQSLSKVKQLESIYVHERTQIRVFVLRRFVRSEGTR